MRVFLSVLLCLTISVYGSPVIHSPSSLVQQQVTFHPTKSHKFERTQWSLALSETEATNLDIVTTQKDAHKLRNVLETTENRLKQLEEDKAALQKTLENLQPKNDKTIDTQRAAFLLILGIGLGFALCFLSLCCCCRCCLCCCEKN